jgi:hypothetical protein
MARLIHHLDLTVSDMARSRSFYEPVMRYLGYGGYLRQSSGSGFLARRPVREYLSVPLHLQTRELGQAT